MASSTAATTAMSVTSVDALDELVTWLSDAVPPVPTQYEHDAVTVAASVGIVKVPAETEVWKLELTCCVSAVLLVCTVKVYFVPAVVDSSAMWRPDVVTETLVSTDSESLKMFEVEMPRLAAMSVSMAVSSVRMSDVLPVIAAHDSFIWSVFVTVKLDATHLPDAKVDVPIVVFPHVAPTLVK